MAKIEKIKLDDRPHLRSLYNERCNAETMCSRSAYHNGKKNTCDRFATYKLDGVSLCKQHAGDKLLSDELKLLHVQGDK